MALIAILTVIISTSSAMFVFLFLDLNIVTDEIFLISFRSLDHRYGPKYLIKCLPYLKVLKFRILFSVLKLYLRDLVTNI